MKHALVLEDVSDAMEMLLEVLSVAFPNIACTSTTSIAEAKKYLNQDAILEFRPDIALIDLELPDGNGVEIIEQLSYQFPDCHIVVATIFEDDTHLFPALQAGADGYLLKDQPHDLLVRQLQNMIGGEPPLSPTIARRLLKHFQKTPETNVKDELLTPREREVLTLLARACKVSEISKKLNITPNTTRGHIKNIYGKLYITSRAEAVLRAIELGLS